MDIELKVPVLPESVPSATIVKWHKKEGEFAKRDEPLVDVETDKIILEVVAPADGVIKTIVYPEGETVQSQMVIGHFSEGVLKEEKPLGLAPPPESAQPVLSPSVRRMVSENHLNVQNIVGSGKDGRLTKADLKTSVQAGEKAAQISAAGERSQKRVPMTRLRARIAERLLEAQQSAAILTTFNEINMEPVLTLRQKYKEIFEKDYGVRLGLMSFFTLAVVEALKRFPILNASIDGQDLVYHDYYDIGVAVSSPRGLVVPIIRDANELNMAEIEQTIASLGEKAKKGALSLEELTGGTFTISNGGVFGSLLSTPILNPPQSAILGMHKIQERPIAEKGEIVIKPMMYVALSYDHRLIDGADSVQFLVTIKEILEDPARLLLNV